MKDSAAVVLACVACFLPGIACAAPHPAGLAAVHPSPLTLTVPSVAGDASDERSGRASAVVIADPKRPGVYLEVPDGGSTAQDDMARHYRGLLRGRKSANIVIVENGRIYFRHAEAAAVAQAEAPRPPAGEALPGAAEIGPASSEPLQLNLDATLAALPEAEAEQAPASGVLPGFVQDPTENRAHDLDRNPAPSPAPDPMRSNSQRLDFLPQSARRSRIESARAPEPGRSGEPPQDAPLRALQQTLADEPLASTEPERPAPEDAGLPEARIQIVTGPAWSLAPQTSHAQSDSPPGGAYRPVPAAIEARGRLELAAGSIPARWLVLERTQPRIVQPDFAGRRER